MNLDKVIADLIKVGKKNNNEVNYSDVIKHAAFGTPDYLAIEAALLDEDIDIINLEVEEDLIEEVETPAPVIVDDLDDVEDDLDEDIDFDQLSLSSLEIEDIKEEELLNIESLPSSIKVDDPVRMYLKEIGRIPLLSSDEEVNLAIRVNNGRFAQEQLNDMKNDNVDIPEDERLQLENMVEDAIYAKNRLVEANYRLVVSIAKRYVGRGRLFLDLIQEGNM